MAGGDPEAMHPAFTSFGHYLDRIEAAGPAVNVAALVGHGAVRLQAMGSERRPPSPEELTAMCGEVAEAVRQGAVGLSTGLIYVPGLYSVTHEVVALAEAAGAEGGAVRVPHPRRGSAPVPGRGRSDRDRTASGVPAHVSHLKCESSVAWGRTSELLDRFHGDGDVTADQYPYAAWASELWSLLPPWAPVAEIAALRADPATCVAPGRRHRAR